MTLAWLDTLPDRLLGTLRQYAVFAIDLEGTVVSCNPGVPAVLGYACDAFLGLHVGRIFTAEDRAAGVPAAEMARARADGHALDERWHLRADGSRFWASGLLTALRDDDGRLLGYAKIVRDATDKHRAQQELEHLTRHLEEKVRRRTRRTRELATEITFAETRERARIARILHDDLQQQLHAAQFVARNLRETAAENGDAAYLEVVRGLEETLRGAITLARGTATDLSPPILEEAGLAEMLAWLAERQKERYGLVVEVEAGEVRATIPHPLRLLVYNVLRELLFNVVKHAGTLEAAVRAQQTDAGLVIRVEDRGRGFDPDAALDAGTGFGLASIGRRLEVFGGSFAIASARGEGTRVTITLPLAPSTLA